MTVQSTRDQRDMWRQIATDAGDDPYANTLHPDEVLALLDQLDQAEHRIARLEAQTSIRGRAVIMYRERAREAEARIRRALEG